MRNREKEEWLDALNKAGWYYAGRRWYRGFDFFCDWARNLAFRD